MKKIKNNDWNIFFENEEYPYTQIAKLIESENKNNKNMTVLKNNSRSKILLFRFGGRKIVAKNPVQKNRSSWIKFLTLFRKSEVQKMAEAMIKLKEEGLNSQKFIFYMEKIKYGMVQDSWVFYFFEEGTEVTQRKYSEVIEILKKLHMKKMYNTDAQLCNFIDNGKDIVMIDCKPKRKWLGAINEKFDFLSLEESWFEREEDKEFMKELLKFYRKGISYHIVKTHWDSMELFRKIKKILRRGRGYENR